MKIGIIQFPGSNCDFDTLYVLKNVMKFDVELVWHKEIKNIFDAVILPGGFSYGDFLRSGIIAAYSPAISVIKEMANEGKPILGICNGFQILIEAGLLPGALLKNEGLKFVCKMVRIKTVRKKRIFSHMPNNDTLTLPIAHGEGRYFNTSDGIKELHENDQIVFKYVDEKGEETEDANPNGSLENIAGVCNLEGNVLGLMPHPERASEKLLGSEDGRKIFSWLR